MAGKQRYTPQQIIEALERSKGLKNLAAKALGCDVDTVGNYIRRYPKVRAVAETQRGLMVDLAESKLYEAIQTGQPWAITLCLKTLGKDRGYVERQEQTGKHGGALQGGTQVQIHVAYDPEPTRERLVQKLATIAQRRMTGAMNGHDVDVTG
jgi:hypothetical protein